MAYSSHRIVRLYSNQLPKNDCFFRIDVVIDDYSVLHKQQSVDIYTTLWFDTLVSHVTW